MFSMRLLSAPDGMLEMRLPFGKLITRLKMRAGLSALGCMGGVSLALVMLVAPLEGRADARSSPGRSMARAPLAELGPETHYVFPATGPVALFRPEGVPKSIVISLSDKQGWTKADTLAAQRLAEHGALVGGVSTPEFLKILNSGKGCINPNYGIIDLARDIQHRARVPMYLKPLLLGRGQGGALAYAALASGPEGSYRAALSIGFRPFLPGSQGWCQLGQFHSAPNRGKAHGSTVSPGKAVSSPWIIFSRSREESTQVRAFTNGINNARLVELDGKEPPDAAFAAQIEPLLNPVAPVASKPGEFALPTGLPLTIVADEDAPRTDMMAVLYSGDGGWAGLDRDVAAALAKEGVPVVGLDSLAYFWNERSPASAAADLDAIIEGYSTHWHRPRVVLVGYSFGADALPYIADHLSPAARARVKMLAMLGLSSNAEFQFHLSSWLDMSSTSAYPTIPAITRLRGLPMLCVQGADETDSACRAIPKGVASVRIVPGGHHFDGNAPMLARAILSGVAR
jgi:type IV secretory pathway VirJ component